MSDGNRPCLKTKISDTRGITTHLIIEYSILKKASVMWRKRDSGIDERQPYNYLVFLHEVTHEWLQGAAQFLRLFARRSRSIVDERGARKYTINEGGAWHSEEYDKYAG
jgi:hypothetical protein